MKKVSIIVPVHNSEKYIEKCITSILEQNYKNFELILINDNSNDSSEIIMTKYAKSDKRVRIIHVSVGNPGMARNAGMKVADGDYIAFVDSDDWIEPEYLSVLVSEIETNDCDCAMCGTALHFEDGTIKSRVMSPQILNGETMRNGILVSITSDVKRCPTFYLWDKVYKRSLWEKISFDSELRNGEDRVALYALFNDSIRTVITDKLLYNYRMGIGITSNKIKNHKYDDYIAVYKMLGISQEKKYDPSLVYQTIVSHTLGKARGLIAEREAISYYKLADEFKIIYPFCKKEIAGARLNYKLLARVFRYFPAVLYYGYALLKK